MKDKLRKEDGTLTAGRILIAGMSAGALEATIAVTPAETLKTRLIDGNTGMIQGAINIVKKEGPGGLYKGWGATVAKQSSNQGERALMIFTL